MTEMSLRLVAPGEADLPVIASLVNRAFLVHRLMRGDRTDPAGLLEEAREDGRFILAEDGRGLIGTAMIRPVNESDRQDGYAPPLAALYYGLAGVEPSRMKAGVGRLMLSEAERIAKESGRTHVVLNTLHEFDLVPYYVRQGYAPVFEQRYDAGHWGLPEGHRLCYLEKGL